MDSKPLFDDWKIEDFRTKEFNKQDAVRLIPTTTPDLSIGVSFDTTHIADLRVAVVQLAADKPPTYRPLSTIHRDYPVIAMYAEVGRIGIRFEVGELTWGEYMTAIDETVAQGERQ